MSVGCAVLLALAGFLLCPSGDFKSRRLTVTSLHNLLKQKDFKQAAYLNSILSQEAFVRSYNNLKAWEELRDPKTGLIPRGYDPKNNFWNPKDTAADLYPFLLMASLYLDPENSQPWINMLSKEREICGLMPCTINFRPIQGKPENYDEPIFGAAEYSKDGLLALVERFGRGPWLVRLEEIAETLIDKVGIKSKSGRAFSSSTEANGDMIQVLTRLYWMTQKEEYLSRAEGIAQAYLFDVFSKYQLPANYWDFIENKPENSFFRLRDHGSEIIAGMAELYVLEKTLKRPQANLYREPLKKFLDRILVTGRGADGLWHNTVNVETHKIVDQGIVDTWGYILNAYQMFDLAEGTTLYADEIRKTMLAVATHKPINWEKETSDGYADTVESMLYLLPWFNIPEAHHWVDREIERMFRMQLPSGRIKGGNYLDGNFVRTAILYGKYKTQGTMAHPWRSDVFLGAAFDKAKEELYLHVHAGHPWQGTINFDTPRHRRIWNIPFEYPRLNGDPQWFIVEPAKLYKIVNLQNGAEVLYLGNSLAKGLALEIPKENESIDFVIKLAN